VSVVDRSKCNGTRGGRATCVVLSTLALTIGTAGCVRTTIRSGLAPGNVPPGWEDRWHHGFVFGLEELPGPIPIHAICPNGWSEIDATIDPIQSVIAAATLGIYTPTTISVVCAVPNVTAVSGASGQFDGPPGLHRQ